MSLTKKQCSVIQLIKRSKPDDEGRYEVSQALWPIIYDCLPDDLVGTEKTESGGVVWFTERGQALADYL